MKRILKLWRIVSAAFLALVVLMGFSGLAFLISVNKQSGLNISLSIGTLLLGLYFSGKVFRVFKEYGIIEAWSYALKIPELDDYRKKRDDDEEA